MKYVCEICGEKFAREVACLNHETVCKERHGKGLNLTAAFNKLICEADDAGVLLEVCSTSHSRRIQLATYEAASGVIRFAVQ